MMLLYTSAEPKDGDPQRKTHRLVGWVLFFLLLLVLLVVMGAIFESNLFTIADSTTSIKNQTGSVRNRIEKIHLEENDNDNDIVNVTNGDYPIHYLQILGLQGSICSNIFNIGRVSPRGFILVICWITCSDVRMGNSLDVLYNLRMMAACAGATQVRFLCGTEFCKGAQVNTTIPPLSPPTTRSVLVQFETIMAQIGRETTKGMCPWKWLQDREQIPRRYTRTICVFSLVGHPQMSHIAPNIRHEVRRAVSLATSANTSQPLPPDDDVVIHYRCGDALKINQKPQYGLYDHATIAKLIQHHVVQGQNNTVAILTQEMNPWSDTGDGGDVYGVECHVALMDLAETLRQHFNRTVVTVYNDEDIFTIFVRLMHARRLAVCGASTFCGVPALASYAPTVLLYEWSRSFRKRSKPFTAVTSSTRTKEDDSSLLALPNIYTFSGVTLHRTDKYNSSQSVHNWLHRDHSPTSRSTVTLVDMLSTPLAHVCNAYHLHNYGAGLFMTLVRNYPDSRFDLGPVCRIYPTTPYQGLFKAHLVALHSNMRVQCVCHEGGDDADSLLYCKKAESITLPFNTTTSSRPTTPGSVMFANDICRESPSWCPDASCFFGLDQNVTMIREELREFLTLWLNRAESSHGNGKDYDVVVHYGPCSDHNRTSVFTSSFVGLLKKHEDESSRKSVLIVTEDDSCRNSISGQESLLQHWDISWMSAKTAKTREDGALRMMRAKSFLVCGDSHECTLVSLASTAPKVYWSDIGDNTRDVNETSPLYYSKPPFRRAVSHELPNFEMLF